MGWLALNIPNDAEVRYTLDGTSPTEAHGFTYKKPFQVKKTTPLRIRAFETGKFGSKMISTAVGTDIYQDARNIEGELKPGLQYTSYDGEIFRVQNIGGLRKMASGTVQNIDITDSGKRRKFRTQIRRVSICS